MLIDLECTSYFAKVSLAFLSDEIKFRCEWIVVEDVWFVMWKSISILPITVFSLSTAKNNEM